MEKEEEVCILCDKRMSLEQKRTIKERAIASLIIVSKRRKDEKHLRLEKLKTVNIHANCNVQYLRETNINAALKEAETSKAEKRQSMNDTENFRFDEFCIFCGKDASSSYIQKQKKHKNRLCKVLHVTKNKTKDNILKRIKELPAEDPYLEAIYKRLINVHDIVQLNARYHSTCISKFYAYRSSHTLGRPILDATISALQFVINYIIENAEECQFSLKYILEQYPVVEKPSMKYIRDKLIEYLGTEIIIHTIHHDYIICYIGSSDKTVPDNWHNKSSKNKDEEKSNIVKTAANIVLDEIRGQYYNLNWHSSPNSSLNNDHIAVPPNLKLFLDTLIKSNKKVENDSQKWDNRIETYAHCIISSVRPRSFVSPILLQLSSIIHKEHVSKSLIDTLHNIGLCAPYNETVLFEPSNVQHPQQHNFIDSYLKFLCDNMNRNINIIDNYDNNHDDDYYNNDNEKPSCSYVENSDRKRRKLK